MDGQPKLFLNLWPRWMSKKIASMYTCYSEKQIERLINDGSLPYSKLKMKDQKKGCQPRIDRNDLDRLMEKNKIDINRQKKNILMGIN